MFITHAPHAFGGSGHYPWKKPRSLRIKRWPLVVSLQRRDRCPRRGFHEWTFSRFSLARAMISTRFGGNELLLSVGRRVGNVTERDVWRDFKFELAIQVRKFWSRSIAGRTRGEIRWYLPSPHLPLRYRSRTHRGSFLLANVGVAMYKFQSSSGKWDDTFVIRICRFFFWNLIVLKENCWQQIYTMNFRRSFRINRLK